MLGLKTCLEGGGGIGIGLYQVYFGRGALVLVISGLSGAHPFIRDICFNKEEENLNFFLFKSSSFQCPCLLRQATVDRGRFAPDFECDQDGNTQVNKI